MKKHSTVKGFAVLSAATMTVKVLSLLYIPILLAILGDYGNGIYAIANNIFVFIYIITNSGLPSAISKIVSELIAEENYKDALRAFRLSRALLMTAGFILSIVLVFIAKPLTNAIHSPKSYLAVLAISPTIFFSSINSSYRGYFQGRRNMTPTAVSQVLEQIVNTIFTLLLAYLLLFKGIIYACAGGAFATALASICASAFLVHTYHKNKESAITVYHQSGVKRHTTKKLITRILFYSVPLTVCAALQAAGNLIDIWNTKSRLLYAGFSEFDSTVLFNYLNKYTQLINVPNSLIISLSVALMPAIAAAFILKDMTNVRQNIHTAFRICFTLTIPAAVGLSVLSYPLYETMKLRGGSFLLLFGAYVVIIMSCVQIFNTILQGVGKFYVVLFFLSMGIAAKIGANYILIGNKGINILGAIFGNYLYYGIPLLLHTIFMNKVLKIKINIFKHAVKPAMASIIMGAAVFSSFFVLHTVFMLFVNRYLSFAIPMIGSVILGMYTYLFALVYVKGITANDLNRMPSKLRKMIPKQLLLKISH